MKKSLSSGKRKGRGKVPGQQEIIMESLKSICANEQEYIRTVVSLTWVN